MKFHLRDLFWLVLVAAFCALWIRERMQLNKLLAEQAQAATKERQAVQYLFQMQAQILAPKTQDSPPAP